MVRPITPIKDRFWEKVAIGKRGECWLWTGYRNDLGYGIIAMRDRPFRQRFRAHRIAYELHHGVSVPSDILVLHTCDNPPCCNPRHLFLGTQADNVADMHMKNRQSGGSLRGERNPFSKLTEADVHAIRAELAAGRTYTDIGRQFSIDRSVIGKIANGKMWGHLR